MQIKSLQISGFKSFVDKTVFAFRPGITAVVGPNGCGKSNLVDAMRWAMGEQSPRRLRGKSMEDVIFAGAEGRPPIGFAEVVITFDNSSGTAPPDYSTYSEIQITRRLYRTGESEYLINKVPCRLRDVLDFFRDTGIGTKGYTIVEQGQIASIVSSKPEERRGLIEEAAGISKYKARRQEAERKLRSTEQNLLRVSDVLGEIRRQINSIERQARKAARYRRLRETQRVLELSLAAEERRSLTAEIAEAERNVVSLRDQATALETRLAERELALERQRLDLAEHERVLNQGNEVLYNLRSEIKQLESRIEYEGRERETLREAIASKRAEQEQLAEQLQAAQDESLRAEEELRGLEAWLTQEQREIAAAEQAAREAGETLRGIEDEREAGNRGVVDVLTRIARAEDRIAALDDRRAEIEAQLRQADEILDAQQSEAAQADRSQHTLEEGLRNLLGDRDRLGAGLRDALERHEQAGEAVRRAGEALGSLRERRETRRARLASLRELVERLEDVGAASRHLLEQGESARSAYGVRGLVRDLFQVERALEPALGAVLAERADALVVGDLGGALAALEALRESGTGRGVLVSPPAAEPTIGGLVPLGEPLLEHVRPAAGCEDVARALFSGVYLVEDLREVAEVYGQGRIPATFVTVAGDVLSSDGVVRGGGEAVHTRLFSRVGEVRELAGEVARLDQEVEASEQVQRRLETAFSEASDEVENLRNRHHTAALAVANHEKDLERTRERVKAMGEAQEGRAAERSALLAELEASANERVRLVDLLEQARAERNERNRALEQLSLQIGSVSRQVARLDADLTERKVEYARRAEKRDRVREGGERAGSAVREAQEWIERRAQEITSAETRRAALAGTREEAEADLNTRLREEETARLGNTEKRDIYERGAETVRTLEADVRRLRGEANSGRERAQQSELAVREGEMRLQHLDESIRDKWTVDLATWTPPVPDESTASAPALATPFEGSPEDADAAAEDAAAEAAARDVLRLGGAERAQRLDEVRRKLEALGEVNLGAIEEHEELAERHRFLTEQKADLEATVASLREAIQRINRTSRKRFRETFEAVNERFRKSFPRLFGGGRANLVLTESDDVLEAGIDIVAMPPGKRLQNVNLLSGGEKTLTAIALLVALFQVRPSPFFLLDEVDAALDDANVGRFNSIVREMAKASQFLVITHNKRTIELADILYGVTMEEKGVSKLVSVDLH